MRPPPPGTPLALACLTLSSLLVGCPNYAALSGGSTGCRPNEVTVSKVERSWGHTSWNAACHGRSYVCTLVATGKDSIQSSCAENERHDYIASAPSAPPPNTSQVTRGFDDVTKQRTVRAKFAFPPKRVLAFGAVPEREPGKVQVAYAAPLLEAPGCTTLTLKVNAVPGPVAEVRAVKEGASLVLKGVVDLTVFAPLSMRYPQLGVQACAGTLELSEAQIAEMQKFVAMVEDLSREQRASTTPSEDAGAPTATVSGGDASSP